MLNFFVNISMFDFWFFYSSLQIPTSLDMQYDMITYAKKLISLKLFLMQKVHVCKKS